MRTADARRGAPYDSHIGPRRRTRPRPRLDYLAPKPRDAPDRTTPQVDVPRRRPRWRAETKRATTRRNVSSETRPTSVWMRARWIVKSFRGRISLRFGNRP